MFMLTKNAIFEREIRKSRFAAIAAAVADEEAAHHFVLNNSFDDASHNCWAWRIGSLYRFSDDGEPGGTAGKPILQAIEGQDVDKAVVVVSRWFGGVKLGTGGLVRAYGGTAAECLRQADKSPIIAMAMFSVSLGFSDISLVESRLVAMDAVTVTDRDFSATGALFHLEMPEAEQQQVALTIRDLTNGRAVFTPDILYDNEK